MLHVDVRLDTGSISITPGPVNAAADEFHLTVRGVGGHGAAPHKAQDTIPCAAAIVLALQNIAARETDPLASVVVTVGTIAGGYRNNVIADSVKLTGTVRTTDHEVRDAMEARMRRIVDGVAGAYGCSAELNVLYGYPPVVNDAELARAFAEHIRAATPIVVRSLAPTMGAEDFAYFAQRVPGLLVRLGVRNEAAGAVHYAHSARFRLDEDAIPVGIATLVAFARAVGSGAIPLTREDGSKDA
jgi:amidohydrolase